MKALIPALVLVIPFLAFGIGVVVVKALRASLDWWDRRQLHANHEQRRRIERWRAARPTGKYRDDALNLAAEAYADRRLNLAEHAERVQAIETATTNAQVEQAVKDLEVVERPES